MMAKSNQIKLPENAYRKLENGEEYIPVVPAGKVVPEVTPYSLLWGLFYSVLFSMAAAYLGLKIGQVFEAAIPIAILAVGTSVMLKRKNALQENVIIQSIGSSSGVIVAGAIFTIPGLYILGLDVSFFQIFLASLFGGVLGILFLIPFRKYFVQDMHGEFPFPEATATTEVIVAGESGGEQAKVLISAAIVGGIYDFCVAGLGLWKEVVSTQVFRWGTFLADKWKLVLKINIGAAVTGLGYIIGLKYALIIACGSFLAWWVLIPAFFYVGQHLTVPLAPALELIRDMDPQDIFTNYVRHIGIGGIAAAGIIGIIKSSKIIAGAFRLAARELSGGIQLGGEDAVPRTQKDIKMKWLAILLLITFVALFVFFLFGVVELNIWHAVVGILIVFIISFLFTTVAARAIALVGTNPVSGMTLMTLILSSVILLKVGLSGEKGMLAALIIGGVVCTALSMSGAFISDLKIGYWLGTTPRTQQRYKFAGTLLAAASVGFVILVLNKTFGFGAEAGPNALEAPQASAMAAVIKPLMTGAPAPWTLYIAGVFMAIILELIGVPPLAFALGMYLPIYLNTPILAGGLIAHFISKSSDNKELVKKRREKGTLIASGFIAGGAIMGVVAAFIIFFGQKIFGEGWTLIQAMGTGYWAESTGAEIVGFVMFVLLLGYLYWDSKRVRE